MPEFSDLSLEFLCEFEVEADPGLAYDLGATPVGHRRAGGWAGGRVRGPRLNGVVEPIGIDMAVARSDDVYLPDVRGVWRLDDGALVLTQYQGIIWPFSDFLDYRRGKDVDAAAIQWKVFLRFETGDERYAWLNRVLAVARGSAQEGGVFRYRAFEVV